MNNGLIMIGKDKEGNGIIALLDPSNPNKNVIDEKIVTRQLIRIMNESEYIQRVLINACAKTIIK